MNSKTAQPVNTGVQSRNVAASAKAARPTKSEATRISASQRNTFRMMLATGATVAALVGAQAMAILDRGSATTTLQSPAASASAANSSVSVTPVSAIAYSTTNPTPTAAINTSSAVQSAVSQPRLTTKSS